jgi:rhodanese-related sulfurtransferase
MKMRWLMLAAAAVSVGAMVYNWRAHLLLPWFECKLERQFGVAQIAPDSLSVLLDGERLELLLFDTRSPEEFRTSRLEGAMRVDWNMKASLFVTSYGLLARGRNVVFYCSIGHRSSAMMQRLDRSLKDIGVTSAVNLSGGIFGWYNQGRVVVDSLGRPTDSIHSYDKSWSHLVKRR